MFAQLSGWSMIAKSLYTNTSSSKIPKSPNGSVCPCTAHSIPSWLLSSAESSCILSVCAHRFTVSLG